MLNRGWTPALVKAKQNGSVLVDYLTEVVMRRRRRWQPEQGLVPLAAERYVADAYDCPGALHHRSTPRVAMGSTYAPSARCQGATRNVSIRSCT